MIWTIPLVINQMSYSCTGKMPKWTFHLDVFSMSIATLLAYTARHRPPLNLPSP